MALLGVDVSETVKFVPEKEKGAENPTTFHIGILSTKDRLMMGGELKSVQDDDTKKALFAWELIKRGVKKIENVVDPKTKQLTTYDVITDDVLALFSREEKVLVEVASKVIEFNNLTELEQKN